MSDFGRTLNMFGLACKKHSPEILMVGAGIGFIGTVITACKATRKLDDVLDKTKERVEKINKVASGELELPEGEEPWTPEVCQKNLVSVYVNTGIELAKLYAPAIICGTITLGCALGSTNILNKRNASLSAALLSTTSLFKDYRKHVVDKYGVKEDFNLRHGIIEEEKEVVTVNEDGTTDVEVVKTTKSDIKQDMYTRCFDETNPYWVRNADKNKTFLICRMKEVNMLLKHKGFLTLNDVLDSLGYPRIKEGLVMGWRYDKDSPLGDEQVDFGIFELQNSDFINGYEQSIWLNFNVQGNVYDMVW